MRTNEFGLVSLREAIQNANRQGGSNQIVFAASITTDGPATIRLNGSELRITSNLEIVGATSNQLTIDGDYRSHVFAVDDWDPATNREVTLSNLKITKGRSSENGGAILSTETLILIGCTITDSSGVSGGGVYSKGVLNVWESLISDNKALTSGGAIFSDGTLSIVDTTLAKNSADITGAGIEFVNRSGYFVVINSTIAGNTAGGLGGGIRAADGTSVRMANTIVAGNLLINGSANDIAGVVQSEASFSLIGVAGGSGWVNGFRSTIIGVDWKTVLDNDGSVPLLKNHDGRSDTIALLPKSPAINVGYSDMFSDIDSRNDQRGPGFLRKSRG